MIGDWHDMGDGDPVFVCKNCDRTVDENAVEQLDGADWHFDCYNQFRQGIRDKIRFQRQLTESKIVIVR